MHLAEVAQDDVIACKEVRALHEISEMGVPSGSTRLVRLGVIEEGRLVNDHPRRRPARVVIERLGQGVAREGEEPVSYGLRDRSARLAEPHDLLPGRFGQLGPKLLGLPGHRVSNRREDVPRPEWL